MANPRRNSFSLPNNHSSSSETETPLQQTPQTSNFVTSLTTFLKRPQAFPFLLSIFLLLTWVSLRIQHLHQFSSSSSPQLQQPHHLKSVKSQEKRDFDDEKANLVRFSSGDLNMMSKGDKRGWLLNPLIVAHDAKLKGGAVSCASAHVGEIRPGGMRGNHRHYTCNETFVIWGAETKFRVENPTVDKGYVEVIIGAEDVAVASTLSGIAHALINVDPVRTTLFVGCQDSLVNYGNATNDFKVWKDL